MDDNMDIEYICCVDVCKHVMRANDPRTFYRFPLGNEELVKSWITVLGLDKNFVPDENSVVCCDHFTVGDYVKRNGIYDISHIAIPSRRLTSDYGSGNDTDGDVETTNNTEVFTIKEEYDTDDPNTIVIEDDEPNLTKPNIAITNVSSMNQNVQSFDKNSDNVIKDSNSACNAIILPSILPSNSISKCENTLKPDINECFAVPVELMTFDQIKSTLAKFFEDVLIIQQEKARLLEKVKNLKGGYVDKANNQLHFELLRYMVAETENQLLKDGVDTSNYRLFNIARVKDEDVSKKEFELVCKSIFRDSSDDNTTSQSDNNTASQSDDNTASKSDYNEIK